MGSSKILHKMFPLSFGSPFGGMLKRQSETYHGLHSVSLITYFQTGAFIIGYLWLVVERSYKVNSLYKTVLYRTCMPMTRC